MAVDVHVVTPEREVWSGQATMVIARGVEGEVGILAGHAPLLVRLAIGPLRIQRDGEEVFSVVDGGFLHVTTTEGVTRVDVLAPSASLASEIDVERERRRVAEVQERITRHDDAEAHTELAKALARVNLRG
ncbi:MAG: ATP synthase F1 subunit epsilon [Actinobacteria bacterium RBG_19FT_COMBO_70_19]|jgi:F-type H+-transporting ATPase subunit epsilon|nr:MAG: ATP synthase F1 subunit epsilon [Actinobacteria bacterium RBG_19FT_COMBO_70_19]